jgi:hypothetical protein
MALKIVQYVCEYCDHCDKESAYMQEVPGMTEQEIAAAVVQYLRSKNFTCKEEAVSFSFAISEENKQILSATVFVGTKGSPAF